MSSSGLALIYLKHALQQPGCPVCRCCAQHEARYLKFLLWENINDVETRVRMAQSFGFCERHARQMLNMELGEDGLMLGNSIIYESLIKLVLRKMHEAHQLLTAERAQVSRARQFLGRFGIILAPSCPKWQQLLAPKNGCRVCELGEEMAQHYAQVLLEMLSDNEFRELYARSDGVCLPHLRTVLRRAHPGPNVEWLLSSTENRLERLRDNLERLRNSYSVQCRGMGRGEEDLAVERAIAFLTNPASSDDSM